MVASEDDTLEDARLARRVAAPPDPEAEAALCRRLWPRIRAYGLLHMRDTESALDLAQHVLVVVIEALRSGKVRDLERFSSYLSGACRYTVLDWRKGDRRRNALLERFGPSFASVVEPAADIPGRRLEDCLGRLGERDRSIVLLTYFAELSADEIAKEQAMSPVNVRVARHRALDRLHDCLGRTA